MKKNFLNEDGEGSKFRIELPEEIKDYEPCTTPECLAENKKNRNSFFNDALMAELLKRPVDNFYSYRPHGSIMMGNAGIEKAPPVVQPASTPSTSPSPTPAPSKNITPYVYAGIGLIVIYLIARMVTKK